MNDDSIQMLIFLIIFIFSMTLTNGFIENTTSSTTLYTDATLPIEKLLNQQYDNRQMKLNRSTTYRPSNKSNSIEMLKKIMSTYRQRSPVNYRAFISTTNNTSMFPDFFLILCNRTNDGIVLAL